MHFDAIHRWDLSPKEAVALQRRLCDLVETEDSFSTVDRVAGVDVGIGRGRRQARAAVVVLSLPDLELCDHAVAEREVEFSYVPGLLSFREVPVILRAMEELTATPDVILCDGQGYAHPRRFGLACHLGVITDIPTVGVAKSRLVGEYREPGLVRGAWSPLIDGDEEIGAILRTRTAVRPLYVSVGHRICLETAVRLVLEVSPRYRLPETTRWAHRLATLPPDAS